jgi:hypothetical protein
MPLCAALVALPVQGDELKPYSLPSQQVQPRIEQHIEQRSMAPTISEEFYQNYALQVRSLDQAQRQQLLRSIEHSFVQAFHAGQMEEARHYRRLIHIVRMAPEGR